MYFYLHNYYNSSLRLPLWQSNKGRTSDLDVTSLRPSVAIRHIHVRYVFNGDRKLQTIAIYNIHNYIQNTKIKKYTTHTSKNITRIYDVGKMTA